MMTVDELKFSLSIVKTREDFVEAVVEFISSIEDPKLRLLVLAELEATLLEGRGKVSG